MIAWRRKLGIAAIAALLSPVAAELLLRTWYFVSADSYDSAATKREIQRIVSEMTRAIPDPDAARQEPEQWFLHPFTGWTSQARLELSAGHARSSRTGRWDDRYVVLIVGGSVAGLLGTHGAKRMAEILEPDPRLGGRKLLVLNYGRGMFKQPQQTFDVCFLLGLGLRPDVIINIDGFNELALGNHNADLGAHPQYPYWPRWGRMASEVWRDEQSLDELVTTLTLQQRGAEVAEHALGLGFHHSALLGRLTARRMRGLRTRWAQSQARWIADFSDKSSGPPPGPAFEPERTAALATILRGWAEHSRTLQALCRERSITYLHVLQPTLHDEGSKPLTPEEIESGNLPDEWRDGIRRGYPALRKAGRRLAQENVNFLDSSMLFADVSEKVYYDGCHFRGRGMKLFAEVVAEALLAL